MKITLTVAVALSCCAPSFGARFEIAHLKKLVRVADPQISPDGKTIAAVISRPNYEDDRYDAELVLIDVATRKQRVLTHGRRGVAFPRWSPSGDRLAFLALAGPESQIFVMPMNGGDAFQVTKIPTGVQQFAWRPDGEAIAFAATDEAPKRTGEEKHNDVFEVGNNDYLVRAAPRPTHLWLTPAGGGDAQRLTSGSWTLPVSHPPSSPASPIEWSPDGKFIAFVKVADAYSGDADRSSIQVLDVASKTARAITGKDRNEGYPLFSPDGSKLAYWHPREGMTRNVEEVYLVRVSGGEGASVTRKLDRNISRTIWMPDGKSLLVGANDGTGTGLWIQPVDGTARRIPTGKVSVSGAFWMDISVSRNGDIAFAGSEPAHPAEVYFLASAEGPARRLTNFNDEVAALELGKTESIEWDGPNGFRDDGVVTYPPDFAPERKYPLVLYVHGGPRSASKEAFNPRAQLLAAKGWVIFEPNYRGSDNLGNAFQAAIWNDAGEGPGRDVMSGVDVLKKRGFVDEARMAVTGWSYGGYMTTWLLGNFPVWKAAIAGAAVTDLVDQYALGDANVRRGQALGGSPYVDGRLENYIKQSPITYATKIRAPTLILSDTGDYRVTVTQSYKLYHVLKDNGVTTQFFAYPIPGHSPADPVRQRDVDRRWIDWLEKYL
jgi:dipeptidyl aminopeptidase/acylaminoacyl peptidase